MNETVAAIVEGEVVEESTDEDVVVMKIAEGKFNDQGDAEWIVIRGQLRGQNDMLSGGHPWQAYWPHRGWLPSEHIWWFQLLLISNILF
jgi:hypothetical protein